MKLGISAKVIHNPRLQFVETFTGEFLYDLSNEYPEVVENLKLSLKKWQSDITLY